MNQSTALTLAAIGGAILPVQFLINAKLSAGFESPLWGTTVSFIIGTAGLLAIILLARQWEVNWSGAASLPWWAWIGGLMGAVYVGITILTVPVLGATVLVLLLILGQMTAGTLLDHFGVLTEAKPVTLVKLVGLVMVFAGTWLVVRS